jgi:ribosomal protein S18 acetylase RimI-like enzyme
VSGFEIRLGTEDDAEGVAGLIHEAFLPFRRHYTDGAFEYTTPGAEIVRGRFAEGPIWVAEEDGLMVGTVSGLPEGERFYIRSMAVKPGLQGRGVGRRLLAELEKHAREAGFEKLYLYTMFVLVGARRLYEKNGFYIVRETLPEEWYGVGGLEMEKDL